MKQYISKSALIAEIESKKNRSQYLGDNAINGSMQQFYDGMKQGYVDILSFINTLEVKEMKNFIWNNVRTTIPEDSTNQIICIKEDGLAVSTIGKIVNGTVKWAYLDDLLNTNSFNVEVKEPVSEDLEEEIDNYVKKNGYDGLDSIEEVKYIANHFAKWQKERVIDKACNFIYEQLNNGIMECGYIEPFINNFKKAMEE